MGERRDEALLLQLYQTHRQQVYAYLYPSLRDPGLTEDLVQETFLRVMRSIGEFRGDCSVLTWILTIAKRTKADYFRSKEHRLRQVSVEYAEEHGRAAPTRDPQSAIADRLDIWDCLYRLSESQRTLIIMRDIEGRSTNEVAERLGLSPASVRVMLHRARKRLHDLYMQPEGRTPSHE